MLPNIVLIGFMGSGKSSVGRRIAGKTGRRFVDTDDLIVARAGKPIAEIFARHGEAYFRDLETAVLEDLADPAGIVLATGGGIILREKNHAALRRIGPIFWLDAEPDVLFGRVSRDTGRPLLRTENPRASFDALLGARRGIYEAAATRRIDTSALSHDEAADLVIAEAERFSSDSAARGFGS